MDMEEERRAEFPIIRTPTYIHIQQVYLQTITLKFFRDREEEKDIIKPFTG
jgi:hypothetical protein